MRQNLPVTSQERTFPAEQRLISTTDLSGTITYANDAFVAISGFSKQELIGQPHNLVRHPDMPPAAFANMWQYLKAGKAWMGLVKNRCKNGAQSQQPDQQAHSEDGGQAHGQACCKISGQACCKICR